MDKQVNDLFQNKTTSLWKNKQRLLVVSSRGPTQRHRHLMMDFINLLPHAKKEAKLEKKEISVQIQELCEAHSAQNFLYFETRKKKDLYLWMGKAPNGPSIKFRVENIHTLDELKITGNCLKGSRPILSFDGSFDANTHLKLIKELIVSGFNVPQFHPKSQPFIDHTLQFSYVDNKIWLRNYQIAKSLVDNEEKIELYEIGPRIVLHPICILDSCMTGESLYQNSQYLSSNKLKQQRKRTLAFDENQKSKKKVKRNKKIENLQINDDGVYNEDLFDY